jgi:hypothetical protein
MIDPTSLFIAIYALGMLSAAGGFLSIKYAIRRVREWWQEVKEPFDVWEK